MNEISQCESGDRIDAREDRPDAVSSREDGVVVAARVLFAPPPVVPEIRLDADEPELSVELLFTIGADGSAASEILQSSGYSAVDAATLDAAVRWRFAPATLDGRPVQSFLRTRLTFAAE